MRINGTYVALILGAALGVLVVVLGGMNEERAGAVDVSTKTNSVGHASDKVPPDTSLNDANDTETERKPDTYAGTESDNELAARVGNSSIPSSIAPSAPADIGSMNQDGPPHHEAVPFRASPSVMERCRTRPAPTPDSCQAMSKFLEQLAREERDAQWAMQTEARIRAVVAARQDGTEIRALECKSSLCAIKTESPGTQQHLSIFIQEEQEAAGVVDDGSYVLAWEEDPVRGAITITERILTRRHK